MAIAVVKGSDVNIVVNITDKESGEAFDLTGFSSASAFFAQDGSDQPLIIDATLHGPPECGKLDVPLTKDETALLQAGDGSNMEVRIDQGATRTIVQFEGAIDIKSELF